MSTITRATIDLLAVLGAKNVRYGSDFTTVTFGGGTKSYLPFDRTLVVTMLDGREFDIHHDEELALLISKLLR